jgi:m7GpppX diphosphatase
MCMQDTGLRPPCGRSDHPCTAGTPPDAHLLQYAAKAAADDCVITVDTIHPCTAKHISKHSKQAVRLISETAALYDAVTKPYIEQLPISQISWVYNILEKKKEVDRMIFEDVDPVTGFMLHPDLKWDESQVNTYHSRCAMLAHCHQQQRVCWLAWHVGLARCLTACVPVQDDKLYCVAIVNRRDLKSMRDLRGEHIALLENILDKGQAALEMRYQVSVHQLRAFLHYHPSYYHLHVHFMHMGVEPTSGMVAGKAHLLTDVINNLAICGEYYVKSTIACMLGEQDPLYAKLKPHLHL